MFPVNNSFKMQEICWQWHWHIANSEISDAADSKIVGRDRSV